MMNFIDRFLARFFPANMLTTHISNVQIEQTPEDKIRLETKRKAIIDEMGPKWILHRSHLIRIGKPAPQAVQDKPKSNIRMIK